MAGTLKTAPVFAQGLEASRQKQRGVFSLSKCLFGCNVLVIIITEKEGKKGDHHAVPDPATVRKSPPSPGLSPRVPPCHPEHLWVTCTEPSHQLRSPRPLRSG